MKQNKLIACLVGIATLLAAALTSYAQQSRLPPCQGNNIPMWSNCVATETWPDGWKYVGEYRDGKKNGQGTLTWPDGDKYVGEWRDNKRNGQGTLTWPDGDKYVGEWRDDKRNGQGTYSWGVNSKWAGDTYFGEWRDNNRTGQGTYTYASGSKYVGEFRDGKRTGWGVHTFADGRQLVGEFKDGSMNGLAIDYNPDRTIKNSGRFENNKLIESMRLDPVRFAYVSQPNVASATLSQQSQLPPCAGIFSSTWSNCVGAQTWPNGEKYVGEYRNGDMTGWGVYTFTDGRQQVGVFRGRNLNGLGIEYNPDRTIKNSGRFVNDKLVESMRLDPVRFAYVSQTDLNKIQSRSETQKTLKNLVTTGASWREALDRYVQIELKQWLSQGGEGLEEISAPSYPPALSLKQEAWETNKEFEDRVQKSRDERRLAIDRIQANYRSQVEARNRRVADYNKARQEREAGLSDKRRQLILTALEVLKPPVILSDVAFDQQSGALTVAAQVEKLGKQTFAFTGTPQEFRRSALTSTASIRAKPEFVVSNLGELTLQAITLDVAGTSVRGVPSSSVNTTTQQVTVNLPAVVGPVITQQSVATVDKNQVEQILYRDENEMLRKRLDDQRKAQEQALASEQAKAAAEIAKLRAEADALRKQPAETRPSMNVANVREAHALVIGNSAYSGSNRLPNPVNDANAISAKLRSLGFRVTDIANTSREQMVRGLAEFSKTASNADLTLFYYAGHGVQIAGTNYMIPVDMNLTDVSQAALQAVSLNSVVEQYLPGKTKLVFLDACRDNPLMASVGRGVSKGLAPINVSEGTLIAYATKDGQTAEDRVGQKNSPFTSALIEHLSDPEDIAVVLRTVRSKVMQRTNNRQQPWEYGSLTGGALVLSSIRQVGK